MPITTPRARRYVFTLNNYSSEDVDQLVCVAEPLSKYLVFGREVSESGTPHLQGFVVWQNAKSFSASKTALGQRCHLEVARADSTSASNYCKKDDDFEEFGDVPNEAGKRTDWDKFKAFVVDLKRVPTSREIINHNAGLWGRYRDRLQEIAEAYLPEASLVATEPRLGWQTLCAGRINGAVETESIPRVIDFFVDPTGNTGKTWICQWALTHHPEFVQILSSGKRDDLCYAIDHTKKVFLFDVPRGQMEYFQYAVPEMLKNRLVFSTKYHSRMKTLPHVPYVAVFCNEDPNMDALSADRYRIVRVAS